MFGGRLGIVELILILVVALVIFGPAKLPEIGKAVGKSLKEFKKETSNIMGDGDSKETEKTKEKKEDNTQEETSEQLKKEATEEEDTEKDHKN